MANNEISTRQRSSMMNWIINTMNAIVSMPSEAIARMFSHISKVDRACGYPYDISIEDYVRAFKRNSIARRCVKLWPDECWKQAPEVYEDENPETKTAFEMRWDEINDEVNVLDYLHRIDVQSGIGEFGVLLMGFDGNDTLDVEVTSASKLLYLKALNRSVVKIKSRVKDVNSPRYGLPEMYSVDFENVEGSDDNVHGKTIDVHASRVLHVADNRMSSEVYGSPRLEVLFNRLIDLDKLLGGSAEMFWKGGFFGIALKPIEGAAFPDDMDDIKDEMHKFFTGLQRYLAIDGVDPVSMSPQVADPSSHFDLQVKALCIGLDVPYRTFMGTEKSELTSTEEKRTWNDRVAARCSNYLTPYLVRPFVKRLIDVGVLPQPKNLIIDWPDLNAPSDKEKAEVAARRTDAFSKYASGGAASLCGDKAYLTIVHGYTDAEADAMLEDAIDAEDRLTVPENTDDNDNGDTGDTEDDNANANGTR